MSYDAAFGDAGFTVLITDQTNGSVPGWDGQPNIIVTTIPGSDPPITEVETVWTQGPSRVTWRLEFATVSDYLAMVGKMGTIDTLSVPSTIQAHSGSELSGTTYLTNTLLMALGPPATFTDGYVECDATFLRQLDPATGNPVTLTT